MRYIPRITLCLCLGACTQLPDIPDPVSGTVGGEAYPTFVPLDDVVLISTDNDLIERNVDARVANLRSRAARLKNVQFD